MGVGRTFPLSASKASLILAHFSSWQRMILFAALSLTTVFGCGQPRGGAEIDPRQRIQGPPGGGIRFQVRSFRSTDRGRTWTLDPGVIAHDFTSLHACTFEGMVWLSGLRFVTEIPESESENPTPFVDVYRSRDGKTWTGDRIPLNIDDTIGGVDPACVVGPDGLEMWFAEPEGRTGDPALGKRAIRIWRSHWNGRDAFYQGEVVMNGEGLVDPAPYYSDDGHLRLFLTEDGRNIVEAAEGIVLRRLRDITVPHVVESGSGSFLLGYRTVQPQRVYHRALEDERDEWAESWDLEGVRSCESPSLAILGETWLLFCVERSGDTPGPGLGYSAWR